MCHPEVPFGTPFPEVRTREEEIGASDGPMPALLALPEQLPAPGVLVINDVFGRVPFYEHVARRLAQAGFVALDPEYFFREGPLTELTRDAAMRRAGRLDQGRAVADLSRAVEWLRDRPEVRGAVGTIGFCMGGTFVLRLDAARADLGASVCYYGFPADAAAGATPIELAGRMRGPILGHWGDQDAGVGTENVEALRSALVRAGVPHDFRLYPGLGHAFLKASLDDEAAQAYDQACASWRRTLDFLRVHLAPR